MNAETPITRPLITEAGAYPDIDAEDYHRNPNLLPGPSLSSSGAKKILAQSPFHYWFDSPLNPNRPPEDDKPHFNVGKAAHDLILLPDRFGHHYHELPEGFAWNKTKAMPEAIAEAEAARDAGKTLLRDHEAETVRQVAAAIKRNEFAVAALTNGVTEETIVWQDALRGVWLRARPDFRPNSIVEKRSMRIVADLKFMAPSQATPEAFKKSIANFGYHQSAAFYMDGIEAAYGIRPTHWLHVVVEKEPPYCVSLYALPAEDIERGAYLNRQAINEFAYCLEHDRWPGYADKPREVGLPEWSRKSIENFDTDALAYARSTQPAGE